MSDKKRAFDGNGETSSSKKLKSSDVSASIPPFSSQGELAPLNMSLTRFYNLFCPQNSANASSSAPALTGADLISQKRAEIAAKLAAMKNPALGWQPPVKHSPSVSSGPTPASGSGSPAPSAEAISKRIKRLVDDAHSRLAVKDNPYMANRCCYYLSMPPPKNNKVRQQEVSPQGAGLKMAAHPLLLDTTPAAPQSKKDRYKPMQPKFASIKANTRNIPTPPPAPVAVVVESNPYASSSNSKDTGLFEGAPKDRSSRNFRFNPKGKYVALGNQMRQDNQLEALKQRIAESARKAGLDGDMGIERGIKRPAPPEAEWWDQPLLPNKKYADMERGIANLNIRTSDSPITIYIQHPIPIPAPGDKNKVALKPMMLTKKEQKKMRKLKRAADLQDKRDRQAMGLIPPEPPKVKLSNMMKVLTSDAVQDPTRVEARIRREVAMRKHGHEKMNAERKLTDEQRREKIETKKEEEDKRGIYGAVFKIKNLSDPAHRFKVRKNAEQLNLTGLCIFNPHFSMVYVEGAAKFIKNYKGLMMRRIAWTEAARPRGGEDVVLESADAEGEDEVAPAKGKGKAVGEGEGGGAAVSLEDNKCYLVWEGMLRDRSFSEFNARSCPTDGAAKELLGEKLKGYWDQAKNWKAEEEELL
ncbi:pre-mRNA processing factor 3-domain-containing protein [Mycena maculata]|uniref:Pre-mRNA processing factor 3-domain-containing protein n=1 Tax=Mycena maculata TaxID=230809 RepID=A0AAD7MLP6_9AGAR|nr:pre-mRNA processing factor 3-domain-containing protein [Mycena maculata]